MTEYTTGPICIDELVTVIGEYPVDVRWNGWLVPHIDPLAVEEVMAALQANEPWDSPTHEWREDGALVLTEYDGDTSYSEVLLPNEDGLYALGAYAWVWAEDKES